jgi:hypothetical protein
MNLALYPKYSPTLNMEVFVRNLSLPLSERPPKYHSLDHIEPIVGVDLFKIEKGKLLALALDKVTVLNVFESAGHAALVLDNKPLSSDVRYITRYINKEYLVSLSNSTRAYFVINPD